VRCASDVPVEVAPWRAAVAIALDVGLLCAWWWHPWLWRQVTIWLHVLSMTGSASAVDLTVTLAVMAGARLTWAKLGLTPRQLAAALAIAGATWAANQLVQWIDVAWTGASVAQWVDVPGALLNAYGEELLCRLVLIGGLTTLLSRRMPAARAVRWAVVIATLIFAASHLPHDLAQGQIHHLERYPALLGFGLLMSLVYLQTGNLMIGALLHVLLNEPVLIIAGPHADMVTVAMVWIASGAVIAVQAWRRRSTPATGWRGAGPRAGRRARRAGR